MATKGLIWVRARGGEAIHDRDLRTSNLAPFHVEAFADTILMMRLSRLLVDKSSFSLSPERSHWSPDCPNTKPDFVGDDGNQALVRGQTNDSRRGRK